ncbi:MAG: site-specific tyrosine recombinase/integron integrase [bacterium]
MPRQTQLQKYIKQFLEYLEVERGRTSRTVRNYDFYLCRFCDWSSCSHPSKITLDIVRKYRLHLNRNIEGRDDVNLKTSTQNYHLIALRSFLKYLQKIDVKCLAPQKIELAKQSTREVAFLEPDELARLVSVADDTPGIIGLRDRAILTTLFSSGMRVSELSNLKIDQINLKRDELTVRGKGGKHRVVFLSDEARKALREYLAKRKDTSPYLFVGHDRARFEREPSPLTPRSIQRVVEKYAIAAGITKKITPHTLRHTFATDLLRNGADIRSVQSMLGHESITTTQVYTHVTDRQLRKVHKKFHGKPTS